MPDERLVTAAVITRGKEVLISRRLDGRPPWAFVAGTIEAGETPQEAAVREVAEETGMLVTADMIIGRRTHPLTGRVIVYVAAAPSTAGPEAVVRPGSGLAELMWATLTEAAVLLTAMHPPVSEYLTRELGD
jgi:8-oxo-dGTP pyrophosphatase MutT (NUDIX family)